MGLVDTRLWQRWVKICKMLLHTFTAISPASLLNHPCCLNEFRSIESCSAVRPNHCWYSSDLLEISWHMRSLKCKVSLSSLIPRPRLFINSVYLDNLRVVFTSFYWSHVFVNSVRYHQVIPNQPQLRLIIIIINNLSHLI